MATGKKGKKNLIIFKEQNIIFKEFLHNFFFHLFIYFGVCLERSPIVKRTFSTSIVAVNNRRRT